VLSTDNKKGEYNQAGSFCQSKSVEILEISGFKRCSNLYRKSARLCRKNQLEVSSRIGDLISQERDLRPGYLARVLTGGEGKKKRRQHKLTAF